MTERLDVYEALKRHYSRWFPRWESFRWEEGPIGTSLPRFRVVRADPPRAGDPWAYLTCGAWEATENSGHGFEFFLFSSSETPSHVQTLAALADYHVDHPLRLGSVLELGRPWMDGSVADALFVSLPYPFGSDFEICDVGDLHVQILWLVPITAGEVEYLRDRGLEAFEQLLESSEADLGDPRRPSLAPDPTEAR